MMDDYFPLPPFSPFASQRVTVFKELTSILQSNSDDLRMEIGTVLAAFSILLNGKREVIWEELIEGLEKYGKPDEWKARVSQIFQGCIRMTLYIQ